MNQIQVDQAKLRKLTHKIDAIDITKKLLSIRHETSSQHVIPPSSELFSKKKNEKKKEKSTKMLILCHFNMEASICTTKAVV